MNQAVHGTLRFGCFALDLTRGCFLRSGDQMVALRPAFEVLRYLAQNGVGRLIPKEELYEAVWPDALPCPMTRSRNAFESCAISLVTMITA